MKTTYNEPPGLSHRGIQESCNMKRMMVAIVCLFLLSCGVATGQSTYKLPPPDVVKILDAPRTPSVVVSPTHEALLLVDIEGYPPIRQLARPILRLAGVRIDP